MRGSSRSGGRTCAKDRWAHGSWSRFCRPVARRAALSGVEPARVVLRRRPCSAAVRRADSRAYRLAFAPADRPARARALGVDEHRVAGREADRKERPGHEVGARQSSRRALRRSRRPPGRPCSVTRARALRESSAGEASPGEASPRAMSGQAPSMGTRAYPPVAWLPLAGRASRPEGTSSSEIVTTVRRDGPPRRARGAGGGGSEGAAGSASDSGAEVASGTGVDFGLDTIRWEVTWRDLGFRWRGRQG